MFPDDFRKHIADSKCTVASWDAASSQLVLTIDKEIGPECGSLVLNGVSFVCLPPCVTVEAVASSKHEVPDFPGVCPEQDEWLYVFQEACGRAFYVLAQTAIYRSADPSA